MRRAGLALLLTIACALTGAGPAAASVALVQKSAEASAAGTSVTATLATPTVAGDLLVATVADTGAGCSSDAYSAPSGWVQAASHCQGSGNGPVAIWFLPDTPAGLTSVTFGTGSATASSILEVSEWSGAAPSSPLDTTGTASASATATALPVSASTAPAASGELAITAYGTAAGETSLTPDTDTGWSALLSDPAQGVQSDYEIGPATGSPVSETLTAASATAYGAVLASFRATCTGAALTVAAPGAMSFPSVAIDPYGSSASASVTVTADDETGSGAGWSLEASSTPLTTGSYDLPATATTITSAAVSADAGRCSAPTSAVSYPITLPASTGSATAATLFDAAAGSGAGASDVRFGVKVDVPADARVGTYTSTWTLTVASGP